MGGLEAKLHTIILAGDEVCLNKKKRPVWFALGEGHTEADQTRPGDLPDCLEL